MKIVHVYKDYFPIFGGIEGNIQQIAEEQVRRGHDVTVLVTNPAQEQRRETINDVKIIRASRLATVASTPLSITYPLLLNRLKPDIAHLHFPYPLADVSQFFMGRRWPFVITYHSDIVKQEQILRLYGPILNKVLDRCDRIMPTSENYIKSSKWLSPRADKCTAVPLGIDPSRFLDAQPLNYLPQGERPTLLFVGRHRYYKGVDTLLNAMPSINATLLVGGDGPMRAEWEQLAHSLNLVGDKVHFLGNVPFEDLPGLYHSADMFVLPANSRAEAFGIVLMEAMAAGKPCISTDLSTGTSFIVQNEETGLVVPPKDPPALASAVNALLADPAEMKRMGESGRKRILSEFSIAKMVDRVHAVYENIL